MAAVLALAVAGCGGDDDPTIGDAASPAAEATDGVTEPQTQDGDAQQPGGGGATGGTLTVGDETITFDRALCFLEEQEAAAGGGTIELTGQANGTNAAGEPVNIDFTRFSDESQFAGDDISLTVGDSSYGASVDSGTVSLDGSTLSASGITVSSIDEELTVSFELHC